MQTMNGGALDMEFAVEETPELVVRGHSGDVAIRGTERTSIRVLVEGFKPDRHGIVSEPPIASQSGNRVTVDTHRNHGVLRADLQIEVPVGTDVSINTIDGDIVIDNTGGPVDVSTIGGDVRLRAARGILKITTVAGDALLEQVDGPLTLQTTNGDITILRSNLERFNVHSVNGDFRIETPLVSGEHYFARTTNGDIRLSVPPETCATVQMRTTNGDFRSELPTEVINPSRRNWQGRINGGGANVELETLNGDVVIASSNGAADRGTGSFQSHDGSQVPNVPEMPETPEIPTRPEPPRTAGMPEPGGIPFGTPGQLREGGDPATATDTDSQHGDAHREERSRAGYSGTESLDVLARLERGEISVEEALQQLDTLR